MKVLVTGGAGFIGSTIASACIDAGITPVVLDNLVTGRREFTAGRAFFEGDIGDGAVVDRIFTEHPDIEATVHCAGLVVVPDSVAEPLRYYRENVSKTVGLLDHLVRNGCRRVIFSSSASIYAAPADLCVDESAPIAPTSPYARSKAMVEDVLGDLVAATDLSVISLRYFNPIGADPAMRTGLQVANPTHVLGKLIDAYETGTPFRVTGVDWQTRDGSGMRDYVHVWDLAQAHVRALERFDQVVGGAVPPGYDVINLGTGTGTTVRELLAAFRTVVGTPVPSVDAPRRTGDVIGCYASGAKAKASLGWVPQLGLEDGIVHSLDWSRRWQLAQPATR